MESILVYILAALVVAVGAYSFFELSKLKKDFLELKKMTATVELNGQLQRNDFSELEEAFSDLKEEVKQFKNNIKTTVMVSKNLATQMGGVQQKIEYIESQFVNNHGLSSAITMASKGESVDKIVEMCGVLEAEAELLVKLHQH